MDPSIIDDVARILADKCRAAANDPLAPSSIRSAKASREGARGGEGEEQEQQLLLLREAAATQAEASAEAHVEASAMWDMAREYEREASRLSELLNFAGLPPTLLTPRARLLSAVAARVADALGAASPTPNAALACWAELALRESRAVALKASTDARAAEMRAEAAAVEARSAALAESLRSVREQQHRQGKRRAELEARSVQEMAAKRAEYGRAVARCERKVGAALVAAAGGAAGGAGGGQAEQQPQLLRHALLQQRAERLAAKREQLREAERRAAEFMDLPASVAGARAALEQARERLARSQERLELGLAQL